MRSIFENTLKNHQDAIAKSFAPDQIALMEKISSEILKCFKNGNKLLLCGNGGSASDSQHIAAEFVGRFNRDRKALPAIALTTDTSIITAVANDYSYDDIFSRQVEALGQAGDILIAISTSGNSPNVLKAIQAAREKKVIIVGFSGKNAGKLRDQCDHLFIAQSPYTPHIQEVHITVLHAISEAVEQALFPA